MITRTSCPECLDIDLHVSKPLISLVPITFTTYCFQGIGMSPFLLFSQPITKLAWKSGRSAQMSDPGREEAAFSLFCASH